MNVLNAVTEPYYLFRPGQILRRLRFTYWFPRPAISNFRLPWGLEIRCRPDDAIGYSLHTAGIYDLVMTELIWRSIEKAEMVVDVGANIGYVTSLMAVLTGPCGRVHAFEPHPQIFRELEANVAGWRMLRIAPITLYELALSNCGGTVRLHEPAYGFSENRGLASLVHNSEDGGKAYKVTAARLDHLISGDASIELLKVDVEGHELAVFEGAESLLRSKKIRDIVFEEFCPYPAPTHRLLETFGYRVFHVNQRLFGPKLCLTEKGYIPPPGNPANYLATIDPARSSDRFRSRGWKCISGAI